MIVICEPSCKSFSHEKINEGFLYVLNKVNANNDILFLAHKSHWNVLKKYLKRNNVNTSRIKFHHINIFRSSLLSLLNSLKLIHKLKKIKCEKIIFLSTPKVLMYCLKNIVSLNKNKFFVLHGELEELAEKIVIFDGYEDRPKENIYKKIKKIGLNALHEKAIQTINIIDPFTKYLKKYSFRKLIEKNHDSSFNYVVISKHIFDNLKSKINVDELNIDYIHYPQLSNKNENLSKNSYPKFAIFGYGDSKMLYNLNLILKNLNIQSPFEIRIIGMDNRGTSSFPWVTFPSNGKTLTRNEMESLLIDIDFNLILYTKDRYSLSCSGSIIEAISYCKPIIHLENPCISFYNKNDSIGFECPDLISIANKIKEIVLNYNQELANIESFKINLEKSRDFLSPDNNLKRFSQVFN